MQANPLARLKDYGQSVWCDDIGRELLASGALRTLIERDGVCGLTSNPTIFHRAIAGGTAYDVDIDRLVSAGISTEGLLEALMLTDIGVAAGQLKPVYQVTDHRDGWVSIEVPPMLAYDAQGTVAEVKRLRALIAHPNVMVKVPATSEGVAAIQDLVALGYCINVTLIFSLERYAQVIEAYLSGLEALTARRHAGEDLPALSAVHGVASFFVSRIDTAVDKRLDALATEAEASGADPARLLALRGLTAVASAKAAYRLFCERFSGPRWEALSAAGADLQRPLWASTGTKNDRYSDILYVQELIGPDTVNTLPLATMDAYRDHGDPKRTIDVGVTQAHAHLDSLAEVGIKLEEVTAQLEREGVEAFVGSHEALWALLEEKRARRSAKSDD